MFEMRDRCGPARIDQTALFIVSLSVILFIRFTPSQKFLVVIISLV